LKLTPATIDPSRVMRPASVAAKLGVNPSMVTHWMQDGVLDYVEIDGAKFIPEEVVAIHDSLRRMKQERRLQHNGQVLSKIS
jgi:predicted site-specific integrase-resolvase